MRKVGDKIKVDSYENILFRGNIDTMNYIRFSGHPIPFSPSMVMFCDKEFEITYIEHRQISVNVNVNVYYFINPHDPERSYVFTDEMLCPLIPKQKFDISELIIEL